MNPESWSRLEPLLRFRGPALLAYSGGADSSVLLAALAKAGRTGSVLAATFKSPLHHPAELERARALTLRLGVEHLVIEEDPFADPAFGANPEDRCYLCKKRRLGQLAALARERGALLLDGTNADDTRAYRPGLRALEEAGVLTPLAQAGLTKAQVIELGRWLGVDDWLRPASACLATRVPYGSALSAEVVDRIRRAEDNLSLITGAETGSFRVRLQGSSARLETDPDLWPKILEQKHRHRIVAALKDLGFAHVSLDLEGYTSGSMDRERSERDS